MAILGKGRSFEKREGDADLELADLREQRVAPKGLDKVSIPPSIEELMDSERPGALPGGLSEDQAKYVHDQWPVSNMGLAEICKRTNLDPEQRQKAYWLLGVRAKTGNELEWMYADEALRSIDEEQQFDSFDWPEEVK